MLEIVGQTLQAAVSLLDVRSKLLLRHAERAAAALLWKAAGGACLGLGVLVGLSAAAIAAAPHWGWPTVLGLIAAVFFVGGFVAWGIAASRLRPRPDPEAEELERQAEHWASVLSPPKPKTDRSESSSASPARSSLGRVDAALRSLQRSAKDPVTVASAAFAAAAVLGPFRALRAAAKIAAAASAARSVARAVRDTQSTRVP